MAGIMTAITEAGTDLLTSASPVIIAAISVGVVLWGAKLVWGKCKGMAK